VPLFDFGGIAASACLLVVFAVSALRNATALAAAERR